MESSKKKWYTSISNWLIMAACIILVPVLLINLYIIFQSKTNQDKVPSVFGIKPFIVLSGSMEEEIYKGDLIITKIVEPKSLKVRDVIAFRDGEGTVTTHRIIDLVQENGKTYFITKGDNNSTQDQNLVGFEDVEGIYIFRIPGMGSIMNKLSEPTTIIILLLCITLVFGIGFAISSKRQRELDRKEFLEYKKQKEVEEQKAKEEKQEVKEEIKDIEKSNNDEEKVQQYEEIIEEIKKEEKLPVKKTTTRKPKKDYSKMTMAELKVLAKKQGVKGYSTMRKDELIKKLK